jgi:hypothetical protein
MKRLPETSLPACWGDGPNVRRGVGHYEDVQECSTTQAYQDLEAAYG